MSRAAIKTDNSFFDAKIKLRLDNLPERSDLDVLDCFSGDGLIWRRIQQQKADRKIRILSMDRKSSSAGLHLVGDNLKFLATMDLRRFDVIDLDAYGSPFAQLKMILSKPLKPGVIVFATFIQTMMGMLPHHLLADLGYTASMVHKMPTLFCRHGQAKLMAWLGNQGIKQVKIYSTADGRKNYFTFFLP